MGAKLIRQLRSIYNDMLFPKIWYNFVSNFVMGYLAGIRAFLLKPLFPGYSILQDEPKDAFWTGRQVIQTLRLDWLYQQVTWGLNAFIQLPLVNAFITTLRLDVAARWLVTNLKTIAPYIPIVAMGIGAFTSIVEFAKSDNKSLPAVGKLLMDIAGATLFAVGMGLMTWGGVVGALYTGPALIMAATAVVAAVGLVKTIYHVVQGCRHKENRAEHFKKAATAFAMTFINAAGMLLTLFGVQSLQQVRAGFSTGDWSMFANAAKAYQNTTVLSNMVLGVVTTLGLAKLANGIWKKCTASSPMYVAAPYMTYRKGVASNINEHCKAIRQQMDTDVKQTHTSWMTKKFAAMRQQARQEKIELLTETAKLLNDPTANIEKLEAIEYSATKKTSLLFGVYQSSLWQVTSKTQDWVNRARAELPKAEQLNRNPKLHNSPHP